MFSLPRPVLTACIIISHVAPTTHAQSAVVTSNLNLRSSASSSSKIIGRVNAGDTVTLIHSTARQGYYHIVERDSTKGWIYARYVQIVGAAPPSGGNATSVVDASWQKPPLHSTTLHRTGFPDCGPAGAGGDTLTDLRKNRIDEPASYHPVTFDAILALPYPKNHKPQRTSWPAADLAVIAPYEGIPVSVSAFIAKQRGVIVEDSVASKKGEATNCHALDDAGVDWHVTLVRDPADPKSNGIVVETTPRVRANGHPWTPDMLSSAVANGDSVRISGWLLYDPEHFAQTTNYDPARPPKGLTVRATLWEVHPVTKIEVFDRATGAWRTLP